LAVALKDKENEIADLKSEKASLAKLAEQEEKDRQERLKAELALGAMSNQIVLGVTKLSKSWQLTALFGFAWLLAIRMVCYEFLGLPFQLSLLLLANVGTIIQVTRQIMGPTMSLLFTVTWLLSGIGLILGISMHVYSIVPTWMMMCLTVIWTLLRFSLRLRKTVAQLFGAWVLIQEIHTCPRRVWIRLSGTYGLIKMPDVRDDSVNSVPLRHAHDHLVKYTTYTPNYLIRKAIDVLQIVSVICGLEAHNLGINILRWAYVRPVCASIDLLVSASLARQVLNPKNTPNGLSIQEVGVLVERACATEGYSNINSFESHETTNHLRLNTALYVVAVTERRREQMVEAGF
jgi:hypothetical protein